MCVKLAALFVLTVASVSTLSDAASLDHLSAQLQAYLPTGTFLTYTVLAQLTTSSLDVITAGCCSQAANYKKITDADPCRSLWNKTTNYTSETYSQICTAENVCGTGFKLTAVLTAVTGLVCFVVALTGTSFDSSWVKQSAEDAKHTGTQTPKHIGTQTPKHGLDPVKIVASDQSVLPGKGRPDTDPTPERLADLVALLCLLLAFGKAEPGNANSRCADLETGTRPGETLEGPDTCSNCKDSCKDCGQRGSAIEKILPKWFYQGCPGCAGACPVCRRRSTNYPFHDWARAIGNTVIFLVLALLTPPVSTCFFPGLDTVYVQAVPVVVSFGLSGLLTAWHACQDRKQAAMQKHRTALLDYRQKLNATS